VIDSPERGGAHPERDSTVANEEVPAVPEAGNASPTATASTPSTPSTPSRRLNWSRFAKLFALAGAVIATLTQATSIIDWVEGKFSDDPPPAADTIDPRILGVEQQSPSSLGDHLDEVAEPSTGYSVDELNQDGLVFEVRMHIQGEQGNLFTLRWFIVDVDNGIRLRGESFNQKPAIFRPRNQNQRREYPVWVPRPPQAGTYQITFTLANAKGEPEDRHRSDPFRISSRPPA
jgi:hypothetical protein